ncbi:hypothetical protein GCM10007067_06600 [Lysobacter bugurensis]|uniref:Uncharacterized protein n=1 Tax=Cognatilysobacter bugurensis TaxID=543356 RepID=A0A918W654_9GAMM|nr:hypothetical protein GCM10007067_06600 [Lysobacter bugurensis]
MRSTPRSTSYRKFAQQRRVVSGAPLRVRQNRVRIVKALHGTRSRRVSRISIWVMALGQHPVSSA